ncbi:hypothetical protein SAY87_000305 [Trapa incisa]|uniref:Pentatricopeptide repeat-containing protein n=1 Tax=Trapa incisa TaxID=236973 RepID=A0AAN7GRG0_9MYRT|nr:hypothetical protein SAY87_000305 [Trapa incisa]
MQMKTLKEGLIHHARAIKFGFPRTVFSSNQLIHLYSKSGQLTEAQKLFDEMPVRNVFSWNAIISAHVKGRDFEQANRLFEAATERDLVTYNSMLSGYISAVGHEMDAVELFMEMQSVHGSVKPDEFTLTIMLNLSAKICSVSFGRQLHSYMVKTGNDLNGFATSSLIDMYSKNESFGDALKVFSQVDQGVDLVSRNAMLAACCREGDLGLASDLFWREARLNDVISWNTLISAFTQNGLAEESVKMFVEMEKNGIRWSEHTFAGLLDACSTLKDVKLGKEIHGWVLKNGMISNPFLSSGLIDVYCKCGNMKYAESVYATGDVKNPFLITRMITGYSSSGSMPRARQLFDVLTEKNSVVWTALFCGYVKAQQCEAVFELLHEYRKEEQKEVLDPLIIVSLLGACALQSGLAPGKQAHSYMLRRGIKIDEKLASALIDMYCKSGNIGHAEKIFDRLIERDIVHYNIMIAGYAHSGHGDRAIELYHEMLEKSLRPDSVTFLALLSACRHCGLVELGEQYFHSLTLEHDVLPEIDHYCCMIDLYGRTNCLEKAIDFMKTIPSNMDAAIFGAFLSACKLNGKLQMVREVEEKLLTMEEGNGSRYIQLANLYAEHGHWDEMERIRRKMRGKEAKKLAGCSWLYVEDLVHVFTSGDTTHMKSDAIYSTLGFLTGELLEMADMGTEDCEGMRSLGGSTGRSAILDFC